MGRPPGCAGSRIHAVIWFSPVYESDPVGNVNQPAFLNAVGEIETVLLPTDLLTRLKGIENELGRTGTEHWGPREIDLDILLYDGLVHNTDGLQVPHPRLEERRFALVPFRDIAPDVVHPISGLTIEELARQCSESGRIKALIPQDPRVRAGNGRGKTRIP